MPLNPGAPTIPTSFTRPPCCNSCASHSSTWTVTVRQPSSSLAGSRSSPGLEVKVRTRPSCLRTTNTALASVARFRRKNRRHVLIANRRIRGDRESQWGHWSNMMGLKIKKQIIVPAPVSARVCIGPMIPLDTNGNGPHGLVDVLIAQLLALLTVANGAPVLGAKIFGDAFALPVDGNVTFLDGRPLFGPAKTLRGVMLSILVTTAFAPLIGLEWKVGALVASMAMIGDLFSSFLKRRLGLFASSQFSGLDQIPESLLPLISSRLLLPVTIVDIVLATLMFWIGAIALSRVLFKLRIRDRPY